MSKLTFWFLHESPIVNIVWESLLTPLTSSKVHCGAKRQRTRLDGDSYTKATPCWKMLDQWLTCFSPGDILVSPQAFLSSFNTSYHCKMSSSIHDSEITHFLPPKPLENSIHILFRNSLIGGKKQPQKAHMQLFNNR